MHRGLLLVLGPDFLFMGISDRYFVKDECVRGDRGMRGAWV